MTRIETPFHSAFLKLDRADEYVQALEKEIQAFFKTEPYRVDSEIKSDTNEFIWKVRLIDRPPEIIGFIVGDAIHNFRGALDHLYWQISSKPIDPNLRKRIQFPIFSGSSPYRHAVNDPALGIHESAKTIIETLQPYNASRYFPSVGPYHPLAMLQELSNQDKHREITIAGLSLVKVGGRISERPIDKISRLGPFEDGAEIARMRLKNVSKVEMNIKFTFDVTVKLEGLGLIDLESKLGDIAAFIRDHTFPLLCKPEFVI